jgi:class 3 adenylate cyclase
VKPSDSGPSLKRITLAFRDPDEETAYIAHHFSTSLEPARWAIVSGLVVLLVFGYFDYHIFNPFYPTLWVGRGVCAAYIALGFAFSFTPYFRWLMQPVTASGAVLCSGLAVWLNYETQTNEFCAHLYVGIVVCVIFACMFLRLRFVWAAGSSLAMLGIFFAGAIPFLRADEAQIAATYLMLATATSVLGAYSIEMNLRQNFWQARQLEARQNYENLLHRILPVPVATRLNGGEDIIADDKYVSVLFADIVNSVKLATDLGSAQRLVEILNEIFSAFDRLVDHHGLETVKTIGDGYMVAGNCSQPLACHARAIAELALDMTAKISEYSAPDGRPLSLRIGIHTGAIVAGVMNLRKLSYDLWGDTVNVASRMESGASAGSIQVTQQAHDEIGNDYRFEGPTLTNVPGKGMMSVYRLVGRCLRQPAQ